MMNKPPERVTPLAEWEWEQLSKDASEKPGPHSVKAPVIWDPPPIRKRKMTLNEYLTWGMVLGIIIVLGSWMIVVLMQ